MELNRVQAEVVAVSATERVEEQKLIRRMQMMMNMVMQVIAQDGSLTVDEAAQMIADSRKAALAMFPGKELAYDLIWKPRFQRLMRERFSDHVTDVVTDFESGCGLYGYALFYAKKAAAIVTVAAADQNASRTRGGLRAAHRGRGCPVR